jgi:hypothetical protein
MKTNWKHFLEEQKMKRTWFLLVVLGWFCVSNTSFAVIVALYDALGPMGQIFNVGDTVEYEIMMSIPAGGDYATLIDVSVSFTDPEENTFAIASGLTLAPGDSYSFTSADNSGLAYVVTEDDLYDSDGDLLKAELTIDYVADVLPSPLPGQDWKQATNIIIPEPTTFALLALGAFALRFRQSR